MKPLGAGAVGFWTLLLAAWGGISVFVGPLFGYRPTSSGAWDWTIQNWLLHLIPGAVGVAAGLMMLGAIGASGAGRRGGIGIAALLTMAAGAWFVIGPVSYRLFEPSSPFAQGASANSDFLHQVGANLGPGVLLAILGGMAFKAGIARPRVLLEREPAVTPPAGAGAVAEDRPGTSSADGARAGEAARRNDAATEPAAPSAPAASPSAAEGSSASQPGPAEGSRTPAS